MECRNLTRPCAYYIYPLPAFGHTSIDEGGTPYMKRANRAITPAAAENPTNSTFPTPAVTISLVGMAAVTILLVGMAAVTILLVGMAAAYAVPPAAPALVVVHMPDPEPQP